MTDLTRREAAKFLLLAAAATAARGIAGPAAAQESPDDIAFGWEPDLPDEREISTFPARDNLPLKRDLTGDMPEIYNQGPVGSCVANAVGAAVQYARRVAEKDEDFIPSRMFLYYYARVLTGTELLDNGSRIQNAVTVLEKQGVCKESSWSYDGIPGNKSTKQFPPGAHGGTEPPEQCQQEALNYVATEWRKFEKSEKSIRTAIDSGYPVIFGFTVYSNMFRNNKGVKLLSEPSIEDAKRGGHAVLIVGYDHEARTFRIRNSWGTVHHDKGYFDMTYDYVLGKFADRYFYVVLDTLNAEITLEPAA